MPHGIVVPRPSSISENKLSRWNFFSLLNQPFCIQVRNLSLSHTPMCVVRIHSFTFSLSCSDTNIGTTWKIQSLSLSALSLSLSFFFTDKRVKDLCALSFTQKTFRSFRWNCLNNFTFLYGSLFICSLVCLSILLCIMIIYDYFLLVSAISYNYLCLK